MQQETGRSLVIPLHAYLVAAHKHAKQRHVVMIATAHGKSFTVDGSSQRMRDAITSVGLSLDCQSHGFRKAAGRCVAEAGCTAKQIMSILGYTTLSEAERYTADVN